MNSPSTQGVPWKIAFVFALLEIVGLDCRPFMFPNSGPMLQGPNILKSKVTVTDASEMMQIADGWDDPQPKDINATALLLQLGKNFNSIYMSVDPPKSSKRKNGIWLSMRSSLIRRQDEAISKMPWRIRQLQFEVKRGSKKRGRVLGYRASSKLRQWLWELSRCPINYSWVDYGPKFFPRHIRYGECIEKPCSFPEGMKCRPKGVRTLSLLMWICVPKHQCAWRQFPLKMHGSCKCSCQSG